jgi:hypothetical protein
VNRNLPRILALGAIVLLLPGSLLGVTRDIADLQTAPLTTRQSVISQLSGGVLRDPYDEFLLRPYNLPFVNIERYGNLSPWPDQEGEQKRYVDFIVGNNGNSNVRNGADTLQGMYIGKSMKKITWGVSAAYLTDDFTNSDSLDTATFSDGEELTGLDLRFAMSYRFSDRMMFGGGLSAYGNTDALRDSSFEAGVGGFSSLQELKGNGVEIDFGLRRFSGEGRSWDAKLQVGLGDTELNDFSEDLDDTGAIVNRFVVTEYVIDDRYLQLSGGYNRRYLENGGEMQVRGGYRMSTRELSNTDLAYADFGGTVTPTLSLISQDPVTVHELFVSADTLFVRGWTEIFGAARLSAGKTEGATQVDALGIDVIESIDDSQNRLGLIVGLRQPLGNEKFRLVARARADWIDASQSTTVDTSTIATDRTQTTTSFAIGIETVLNNMVFDLAWLSAGEPLPGGSSEASRQTIDLERLVISATFGW